MSLDASTLRRLAALSLPPEALAQVLEIMADAIETKGEASAGALRQRRYRERHQAVTRNVTSDVTSDVTVTSPEPLQGSPKIYNQTLPTSPSSLRSVISGAREAFEKFWAAYPKHEGRKASILKFDGALKRGVLAETLIDGAARYAASVAGVEARFMKGPAVWLHGEHWNDEIQSNPPRAGPVRQKFGGGFAQLAEDARNERDGCAPDGEPGSRCG